MKKLLALALVVVLTLPLAAMASAATFDPYVGGRITWVYENSDATKEIGGDDVKKSDDPVQYKNSGIKMLLKGKVSDEETGTWGALGAKIDGWADGSGGENGSGLNTNSIYEFGVDKIGGSNFNVWYSNFENEKGNRGQGRIYNIDPLQTHDDCMFDRDLGNVIGIDYNSDNVVVNFGYVPDKNVDLDKNTMSIAATFKFDGGNVHVGYWDDKVAFNNVDYEANEINVGGEMKFGFGTVKVDYLTLDVAEDKDGEDCAWEGGNVIQAGVFFDDLKFDVTVAADSEYHFKKDGGMSYQIRYTGIDNVTFCYRAGEADDKADEQSNFTNFYVGYKYGVIETRVGMATKGEDNKAINKEQEDIVYASCYVSFW